jgi:hypothetical protein
MMRIAVLVALLLLTAACGAYRFPTGGQSGSGVVNGTVMAVPCAPVEQAGGVCAGRPVSSLEIDFAGGGSNFSVLTDSGGSYTIELPTATYKVTVKPPMRILSGPTSVDVHDGTTIVANYVVDSGIRVPLPQQQAGGYSTAG